MLDKGWRILKFIMKNNIQYYIKKYITLIILIISLIILLLFRNLFIRYQYIAEWLAVVSLLGIFMQLKWHRQDIYHRRMSEKLSHKISWKVVLTGGIVNGIIINNTPHRPVAFIRNFSGKNVHRLKINVEMFNVSKIIQNGKLSVTPDGMADNTYHKHNKHAVSMSISTWINNCGTYTLEDTYGDSESSTPVMSNAYLFKIFNSNFSKHPGKYKFNLLFYCSRNDHSETISVIYKYDHDVNKCEVVKASKR